MAPSPHPAAAARPASPERPPPAAFDAVPVFAPGFSQSRPSQLFDLSGGPLHEEDKAITLVGQHRVILHTMEGQVKRGAITDTNLGDDAIHLELANGGNEALPRSRVKAIFFMLAPGARAPQPEGQKVRVTFKDGRQVAGYAKSHASSPIGFFVVPADNRTNTDRIFIYRHAVDGVSVEG
jgi:hypothetical protein